MLPPKLPETDRDERILPCVNHPQERAIMLDRGYPLCETCMRLTWPALRERLRAQQLVRGGLPDGR